MKAKILTEQEYRAKLKELINKHPSLAIYQNMVEVKLHKCHTVEDRMSLLAGMIMEKTFEMSDAMSDLNQEIKRIK